MKNYNLGLPHTVGKYARANLEIEEEGKVRLGFHGVGMEFN